MTSPSPDEIPFAVPAPANESVVISDEMLEPVVPVVASSLPRVDFERGMSYWPIVTMLLIVANIVFFVRQLMNGALEDSESIIAAGAISRPHILQGEVWRLVSAMFLHGSFDHLIGNCIALYILGMACEHGFGMFRMLLIYFIAGLGGSVLSVAMNPGPSIGASGAIFGIMGAVICFFYRYRDVIHLRDKRIGTVLAIWAAFQIGMGFLSPQIDNFAHIGGFIVGAATVLIIRPVRCLRAAKGLAPQCA
jgi:rhomboid protease GluP